MRGVQAQLGVTSTHFSDATVEVEPLRLSQPTLPFAKIDEKKIVELEATLSRRMAGLVQTDPANEVRAKTAAIELEDFKKMDLRIARILEAESVKKSDKLLRITLQLGDETRQVVAGIAKDYRAEALIGTDVIVLANVTPVKLMGVESHGMLLAAEHEGRAVLIRPSQKVPSGTKIK
jgi:methionyl-tRNA synthetase